MENKSFESHTLKFAIPTDFQFPKDFNPIVENIDQQRNNRFRLTYYYIGCKKGKVVSNIFVYVNFRKRKKVIAKNVFYKDKLVSNLKELKKSAVKIGY